MKAQEYLDKHYPEEERKKLTELSFNRREIEGHLDLSDFVNLERLNLIGNKVVSLNLIQNTRLKTVVIFGNNFNTNLDIFSHLFDLEELILGAGKELGNNFHGSLESLKNCKNIKKIDIENCDQITKGLEWLPTDKLVRFDCRGTVFKEILRDFDYDIKAWILVNYPEKLTNDNDELVKELNKKKEKSQQILDSFGKGNGYFMYKIVPTSPLFEEPKMIKDATKQAIRLKSKIRLLKERKNRLFLDDDNHSTKEGEHNSIRKEMSEEELVILRKRNEELSFFLDLSEKENRELKRERSKLISEKQEIELEKAKKITELEGELAKLRKNKTEEKEVFTNPNLESWDKEIKTDNKEEESATTSNLEKENQELKKRITELEAQLVKTNISQQSTFIPLHPYQNTLISEKETELQKAKDDLRFYEQVLTTPAFEKASYEVQNNKKLDARQAENKVKSLERQLERIKIEQEQQSQYSYYTEIPPKGNN